MIDSGDGWATRYVPYNGSGVLRPWLIHRGTLPRIAVTLGTVAPALTGLGPVERIVQFAGAIDAAWRASKSA
jgi:hypothetical protein